MPWVVDGNNLAGGSAREKARQAVLALAHREKLRVVLFFDGAPPPGSPAVERLGSVEVRYVPHADSAILALLQQGGRGWRLVSSDQALAAQARHLGAEVISAREFWHKLATQQATAEDKGKSVAGAEQDYRSGVTPLPQQPLTIRRKRRRGL